MRNRLNVFAPVFLSLFCASGEALATQGDCIGDKCVAFEVVIRLDSYHESPVIRAAEYSYSLGSSLTTFETVVTRSGDSCTKQVVVPRSVYTMITQVMDTMNGGIPVLTPTQQTVLLFYTTLMQQTIGFTCEARDLESQPVIIGPGGVVVAGNGSGAGTGTGTGTVVAPVATNRVVGVFEMPEGNWSVMVYENGQSRNVGVGGYLLGGWRVVTVGIQQVVVERNGEQRVMIVGSLY